MKQLILTTLLIAALCGVSTTGQARDSRLTLPVAPFFERADVKSALGDEVQFYFSDSGLPKVAQNFGSIQSNKKTNAFNKSDTEACEWALLSALLAFKARALELGGNAVINISSNYRNQPFKEAGKFQCGAGAIVAGVTMVGTVVKLK